MPLPYFAAGAFLLQICPNNLVFTNDKFHGIIEKEELNEYLYGVNPKAYAYMFTNATELENIVIYE